MSVQPKAGETSARQAESGQIEAESPLRSFQDILGAPHVVLTGKQVEAEPEEIPAVAEEEAWNRRNILSLDAGGTRGLWSLLVLEKLMEAIAEEEQALIQDHHADDHKICSSFLPRTCPDVLLHSSEGVRRAWRGYADQMPCCPCPAARRYLPCHYFDYICGTSTGALIAIMLGRLRMNVPDCILEYERLGGEVFGKPRNYFSMLSRIHRNRYSAKNFENVIRNLVDRRNEEDAASADYQEMNLFKVGKGACKTFVTTYAREVDSEAGEDVYLIRSYGVHATNRSPRFSRRQTNTESIASPMRMNTGLTNRSAGGEQRVGRRTNHGPASTLPIWQVARAATAAPFYFKPMRVEKNPDKVMYFTDGGAGPLNNPTQEAIREVAEVDGPQTIDTVVSIGTSRKGPDVDSEKPGYFSLGLDVIDKGTNPEHVHHTVKELPGKQGYDDFAYFRFNDPNKLKIRFDDWSPRNGKKPGYKTIESIRNAFNEWLNEPSPPVGLSNRASLEFCAKSLVRTRTLRMSHSKWERFSVCCRFKCGKCTSGDEILFPDELRAHLVDSHNIARDTAEFETALRDCTSEQWLYRPANVI